jgi:hypothetical protein
MGSFACTPGTPRRSARDDLIAMWFEHVCNVPQELHQLFEDERRHWANGG